MLLTGRGGATKKTPKYATEELYGNSQGQIQQIGWSGYGGLKRCVCGGGGESTCDNVGSSGVSVTRTKTSWL